MSNQSANWEEASAKIDIENLKIYLKWFSLNSVPKTYHHYLLDEINKYLKPKSKVIEVGGQLWWNLFLVEDSADKYLLDLDETAIERAKVLFAELGKKAVFTHGDMFDMPYESWYFNVVFNSGVLEHFTETERTMALMEYSRVLSKDGIMIIAVPNHYSFWYRAYYIFANFIGRWRIPKEFKIFDLGEEIAKNNLFLVERKVVCPEPIFFFWGQVFWFWKILQLVNTILPIEGYLTILVIKKWK